MRQTTRQSSACPGEKTHHNVPFRLNTSPRTNIASSGDPPQALIAARKAEQKEAILSIKDIGQKALGEYAAA